MAVNRQNKIHDFSFGLAVNRRFIVGTAALIGGSALLGGISGLLGSDPSESAGARVEEIIDTLRKAKARASGILSDSLDRALSISEQFRSVGAEALPQLVTLLSQIPELAQVPELERFQISPLVQSTIERALEPQNFLPTVEEVTESPAFQNRLEALTGQIDQFTATSGLFGSGQRAELIRRGTQDLLASEFQRQTDAKIKEAQIGLQQAGIGLSLADIRQRTATTLNQQGFIRTQLLNEIKRFPFQTKLGILQNLTSIGAKFAGLDIQNILGVGSELANIESGAESSIASAIGGLTGIPKTSTGERILGGALGGLKIGTAIAGLGIGGGGASTTPSLPGTDASGGLDLPTDPLEIGELFA